jgi:hypothetical protein
MGTFLAGGLWTNSNNHDLYSSPEMTICDEKKETKKQRFFSSASPVCLVFFLLSLKDPPAYRRAKPIIKAMLSGNMFAEHCFFRQLYFSSATAEVIHFSASPTRC